MMQPLACGHGVRTRSGGGKQVRTARVLTPLNSTGQRYRRREFGRHGGPARCKGAPRRVRRLLFSIKGSAASAGVHRAAGGARRAARRCARYLCQLPSQLLCAAGLKCARRCSCNGAQEDYIKDEMKNLKREMIRAKEARSRRDALLLRVAWAGDCAAPPAPCAGDQAHPVRAAGHWAVPGDDRRQLRHRVVDGGLDVPRAHSQHA